VSDLERELDFSVILHNRDGQVDLHPSPQIRLQPGDQICIFASLDQLSKLGRLNRGKA
jgi:Trk K+ transport system NAD-binding subunit